MYCKNCGMKLEEGAKFCGGCGMPVDNEIFEQKQSEENGSLERNNALGKDENSEKNNNLKENNNSVNNKKSGKKLMITGISAAVVAIAAIAAAIIFIPHNKDNIDNSGNLSNSSKTNEAVQDNKYTSDTDKVSDNNSKDNKDNKAVNVPDVSGDTYDKAAIEAYQQEVKSGKCALFYINGCDVPLCAYKSEDNKKEILLAYNKKKSDVEVYDMGDDTKLYYDSDTVVIQYTKVKDNKTRYINDMYSNTKMLGSQDTVLGSEGWAVVKIIAEDGSVTYSSGQDFTDEKWYNEHMKKMEGLNTVKYQYSSISDAYAAIDKKEMYIRKALAAYTEKAGNNKCTLIYPYNNAPAPVCIFENKSKEQQVMAFIDGKVVDIIAASRDGRADYNRNTHVIRMDSAYGNSESNSQYAQYYKISDTGVESYPLTMVYNKYKKDENGKQVECDYQYGIEDNMNYTKDEFNKYISQYGKTEDFAKIYCGYNSIYSAYNDLKAGKDTQLSWKESYNISMGHGSAKCISTVLKDVNNDGIPEVFCEWDEGAVTYTMDYIDKSGNDKQLFYRSNLSIATADGYIKISGGYIGGGYFDTVCKYNQSTGEYDTVFDAEIIANYGVDTTTTEYKVNGNTCSEAEYNLALNNFVSGIPFENIDFNKMGKKQEPAAAIRNYK